VALAAAGAVAARHAPWPVRVVAADAIAGRRSEHFDALLSAGHRFVVGPGAHQLVKRNSPQQPQPHVDRARRPHAVHDVLEVGAREVRGAHPHHDVPRAHVAAGLHGRDRQREVVLARPRVGRERPEPDDARRGAHGALAHEGHIADVGAEGAVRCLVQDDVKAAQLRDGRQRRHVPEPRWRLHRRSSGQVARVDRVPGDG